MSNLSSFVSSGTQQITEYSTHNLSNGTGTLTTFTNSTSGYLYGIYVRLNLSYSSSSFTFNLNTAISGQSNVAITVGSSSSDGNNSGQRFILNSTNNLVAIPTDYSTSIAQNVTGMFIPLETRFSGSTTISWSGTNAGNMLISDLFYDLD